MTDGKTEAERYDYLPRTLEHRHDRSGPETLQSGLRGCSNAAPDIFLCGSWRKS